MGVPYYFRYLTTNYGNCVIDKLDSKRVVLYFDFNSVIYDAKSTAIIPNTDSKLVIEYNILQQVIVLLDKKINSIGLSKIDTIYIAIDGTAPVAKMIQQRQRRYKSVKETEMLAELNKQFGKTSDRPVWDSNAITPGTKFMSRLIDELDFYLTRLKELHPRLELILDSSRNPGEGEHKLLQHMYRNKDSHRDKNKVVYGLDADLIILTMLKGYPNTYLFRESTYYPFEVDKNVEYLFMDINEFRNAIMVDFGISDYVNSKSAFDDYIFLTFLLGNDFIPNLFILKIQKGGFEIMRDIYKDGLRRFRRFLVNETGIDLEFLSFIIYGLYKNENKILGDLNDEHSRWRPYLNPKLDEYDRKKALLNFYPYYVRERDYIQLGKNGWQARYNNYWLGCNDKDIVDNMVTNYLESLEWILAYYRGGCKNWFWHYKYAVAPSLYSLYQGIESLRKNSKCLSGLVEYRDVDNPDAFNLYQLLVVIPKKSIRVIPKKYRDITLKQEFTYLFPHDFKLLTLFKRYYHDCFAVLPRLENNLYSRVEHHINNITI